MAKQPAQSAPTALVQLSYKPGIQRDGTKFQGDYCSDGQWIRFQSGRIKKIRGLKGINVNTNKVEASEIVLSSTNAGQIFYYIGSSTGIDVGTVDKSFTSTGNVQNFVTNNNEHTQWQATKVIKQDKRYIVFLANNNAADITQNTPPRMYVGPLDTQLALLDITEANINRLCNGGMCYSHPLLFLYGSNGKIQYSRNDNPFSFIQDTGAGTAGALTISSDKVIYGRPIRAGSNSPSVLFWTISTVVRIINVGTKTPDFHVDVVSKSTSILSSRCVVESDGFFYWPGTDRFFVYNGLTRNLPNNTNLNYFFDYIDMDFRQKVFGVKANSRYGEIWWYYPEKEGAPLRNPDLPRGANTRAIIYNTIDDCWYDTSISRDCGTYVEGLGYLVTYGRSLTSNDNTTFLWRHEYGTNEYIPDVLNNKITSYITTPTFGWSSFNPTSNIMPGQKAQLLDRWIEISRIEPDITVEDVENDDVAMEVIVYTRKYAQSPAYSAVPITFNHKTEKVDMRVQGRQMSLTFRSGDYFEIGNFIMLLKVGDGQ